MFGRFQFGAFQANRTAEDALASARVYGERSCDDRRLRQRQGPATAIFE